jgi:hypothetical protein
MSFIFRSGLVFVAVLAFLLPVGQAQPPRRQSRLAIVQQQNALHLQRNAVQTAVQQTTALVQVASQQRANLSVFNFQQPVTSLQIAIQQTNALLQTSLRQSSGLAQTTLRQLNTLQTALQQLLNVQNTLPPQGTQLTPLQLGTLSQTQAMLMVLLTARPPPLASGINSP